MDILIHRRPWQVPLINPGTFLWNALCINQVTNNLKYFRVVDNSAPDGGQPSNITPLYLWPTICRPIPPPPILSPKWGSWLLIWGLSSILYVGKVCAPPPRNFLTPKPLIWSWMSLLDILVLPNWSIILEVCIYYIQIFFFLDIFSYIFIHGSIFF